MRWRKNLGAAFQVTRGLSLRTLILALPVAASTALALSIVAIDRGVTATAHEAAVSFGLDQVTLHGAARVIAGKFGSATTLTEESRLISRSVFLLLFGLAAVSVLVASSIVAIMFLQATRARQYEIGLRRAMGAEPGDILRQLWAEAAVVSVLGGLLGVGLGLFATSMVSRWRELPSVFDATALAVALVIVLLTSLAALLPARAAARLAPADALRPVG